MRPVAVEVIRKSEMRNKEGTKEQEGENGGRKGYKDRERGEKIRK
jgi:hypothetical protein